MLRAQWKGLPFALYGWPPAAAAGRVRLEPTPTRAGYPGFDATAAHQSRSLLPLHIVFFILRWRFCGFKEEK
jgi:hypothetical protein